MKAVAIKYLDYHQLHQHFWECGIGLLDLSYKEALKEVRIRTAEGDCYLASIWREGDVIYFDLGNKCDE